jgi:hypothetical protein
MHCLAYLPEVPGTAWRRVVSQQLPFGAVPPFMPGCLSVRGMRCLQGYRTQNKREKQIIT